MPEYVLKIKAEMEELLGCPIDIVEDRDMPYPCKMEYARNYMRDRHVIRVNPGRCPNGYPIFSMMLLAKLQLQEVEGGEFGILQPVSSTEEFTRFNEAVKADRIGTAILKSQGAAEFDSVVNMLRGGLISQASSQVMEMLASDEVLKSYPEAVEDMKAYLKPNALVGAGMPHAELLKIYPRFVVEANRRLNILYAMRCGEFCGEKLVDAYKPTPAEIDQGLDLYAIYRAERDALAKDGRIAGGVIAKLLKELKLDAFVHLRVIEIAPMVRKERESAPDGLTKEQDESLQRYYENYGDGKRDGSLMALGIFKVMLELRRMPLSLVRSLAVEIAQLGANGISPAKKYRLTAFPNRGEIWGEEILAYYYATWAKVFPEHLDSIGLPYKEAYAEALRMLEKYDNSAKSAGGGIIHRINYALAA